MSKGYWFFPARLNYDGGLHLITNFWSQKFIFPASWLIDEVWTIFPSTIHLIQSYLREEEIFWEKVSKNESDIVYIIKESESIYYVRKLIKFTFCKKVKVIHKTMRVIKADEEGEGTTIAKKVTISDICTLFTYVVQNTKLIVVLL